MKQIISIALLWLLSFSAIAQSSGKPDSWTHYPMDKDTVFPAVAPPNIYIKTNPFSLSEPDGAVTLAVEYRKDKVKAYQLEAGYIFADFLSLGDDHTLSGAGFRLKPEWRFYNIGSSFRKVHYANYWAVEGIVKAVYNKKNDFVGRQCSGGDCAYFQQLNYRTSRSVVGVGGKAGREIYLGQNAKKAVLDIFLGLGLRYRWRNDNLPHDADKGGRRSDVLPIERPTAFIPYLAAGLKIGWRVK